MIAAPASPMIGILAAMPAEVAKLKENTSEAEDHKFGDVFVFTTGIIGGRFARLHPSRRVRHTRAGRARRAGGWYLARRISGWHLQRAQRPP